MLAPDNAGRSDLLTALLVPMWLVASGLTLAAALHQESLHVFGAWVSLRNPARPFLIVSALTLLLVHLRPAAARSVQDAVGRAVATLPRWSGALLLAMLAMWVGVRFGSDVASGADSYGYVTHAEMLASGKLRRPESPLAAAATWPNARRSLAPLGWLPAEPGHLVPVYPPGYPILMAAARWIQPAAMFAIVPIAGAATVASVVLLGARVGNLRVGLAAATLLASSPAFLLSLVVPMSDLPATALWTVAVACASGRGRMSALATAAAGGAAVLIRPNLLPLSLAVLVVLALRSNSRRASMARVTLGAIGCAVGALLVAAFQWAYYGAPTSSGYGQVSELFAISYWTTNVVQFSRWLVDTHPLVVLVAAVLGSIWSVRERGAASHFICLPLLTGACYLFYVPFDNWSYLRFLLPAFPIAMVWAALGMEAVTSRLREPSGSFAFALLVGWCALAGGYEAKVRHVFANADSVERFRTVSRQVGTVVPAGSIVVCREFSGSLDYYAGVQTLRWDWLDAAGLAQALATLRAQGRETYALLDLRSEMPDFTSRHRPDGASVSLSQVRTFDGAFENIALYRIAP